jgi:hypothetical protein
MRSFVICTSLHIDQIEKNEMSWASSTYEKLERCIRGWWGNLRDTGKGKVTPKQAYVALRGPGG